MLVSLERTGGFAGISKIIRVDTNNLLPQTAEELSTLVASADFFQLPEQIIGDSSQCDRFQYRLSVEDHQQRHTVIVSETALTHALTNLIDFLNQLPKSH